MKAFTLLLGVALLAASSGSVSALFGFGPAPGTIGLGKSVRDVVCAAPTFSTLCGLMTKAQTDPTVAQFGALTLTGTFFAPDDDAFKSNGDKLYKALGVADLAGLTAQPSLVATVLANHFVFGQVIAYEGLHNDDRYLNAAGAYIELDKSIINYYIVKGPENNADISATGTKHDILAATTVIHTIHSCLIPIH